MMVDVYGMLVRGFGGRFNACSIRSTGLPAWVVLRASVESFKIAVRNSVPVRCFW